MIKKFQDIFKSKIINIFSNIIFIIVLICFLSIITTYIYNKFDRTKVSLFGFNPQHVKSNSMEPVIMTGDWVLVKRIKPNKIEIGDIITYYRPSDNKIIIHRVVDITNEGEFIFKGDNNPMPDKEAVSKDQIRGKCVLF